MPRKKHVAKPLLPREQHEAFRSRIINAPGTRNVRCGGTMRSRIWRTEFGVVCKLSSVYELMHRLEVSRLKPRPKHEDLNPVAMREFAEKIAPFVRMVREAVEPRGERVHVMFMDEAWIGQQGALTNL
jgi:hypothetical protein